jgi:uncharacterized protein
LATEHVRVVGPDGRAVVEGCLVAARPLRRMRGLLGRRRLPEGEGILLTPAASVHTFFMRFPIDVVFLDRQHVVVDVAIAVRPWRAVGRRGAYAVIELPAGESARRNLRAGEQLVLA